MSDADNTAARRARATRRLARWIFWIYAVGLFVGTHWPKATLSGVPIQHPDKILHVIVFAGWTILLAASGLCGPWWRGATLVRVALIAALYGALDEATQAIPILHRHATSVDFAMNVLGVAFGTLLLVLWSVWRNVPARAASHPTEGISDPDQDKTPADADRSEDPPEDARS